MSSTICVTISNVQLRNSACGPYIDMEGGTPSSRRDLFGRSEAQLAILEFESRQRMIRRHMLLGGYVTEHSNRDDGRSPRANG
jgi:hypothetical protein